MIFIAHQKKKKKIKIPQLSIQHKNNTSNECCLCFTSKAQNNVIQRASILQDKALGIIAESTTPAQGAADGHSRGSFLWG